MKEIELNKIENLPYFSKEQLRTIFPDTESRSLDQNIYRWVNAGSLLALKRGMYVTKKYIDTVASPIHYREFIANILKKPSYISLEYVLRKHNVLTEATFGITSVSLKPGSAIENEIGFFSYRNIKEELFVGYEIKDLGEYEVRIATKAKALFDYLYFKSPLLSDDIRERNLVADLRLNLDSYTEEDLKEFAAYAYLAISDKKRSIILNIAKHAPNS